MFGIIGKKIGMMSLYDDKGYRRSCTVIESGPCVVTQLRSIDADGYQAVQLAYDEKKTKNTSKALIGHFQKANTTPKRKIVEFRGDFSYMDSLVLGQVVRIEDVFEEGSYVHITGISKGKGFQGVVKRHGFSGVGGRTHGQHNRERAPGSIGACSFPSRVFKGMRMAGRLGGNRIKVENLKVMKIVKDKNLIVVSGSVPGSNNSYIILEK